MLRIIIRKVKIPRMLLFKLLVYMLCCYGIANMFIYGSGPFRIFERIRSWSNKISSHFGEVFTCFMCFPTWIGLVLSAIDVFLITGYTFTPFSAIINDTSLWWLIIPLDAGFTSGSTFLIHQLDEMMERVAEEKSIDNNEDTIDVHE